jgi:hypothetical protein
MRSTGQISRIGDRRGIYRVLVGKPERRKPLGSPRIILNWILEKLDGGIDWIDLAQHRGRWRDVTNAVINLTR